MRFLLDENLSYRVAAGLTAADHDAVHVGEIGLTSTDDAVVLARARELWRDLPVIVVSGHADTPEVVEAMRRGAADFGGRGEAVAGIVVTSVIYFGISILKIFVG